MPPFSEPPSPYSSDDSVQEELQSLRRVSTSQGISSGTYKVPTSSSSHNKAHSTNSSPLRNKPFGNLPPHRSYDTSSEESSVISYRDYSDTPDGDGDQGECPAFGDVSEDEDGDAILTLNKPVSDQDDAPNLSFDPFHEPDLEQPIANSTAEKLCSKSRKHFKISKTVRFRDWDNPISPAERSLQPKKKSRFLHRSKSILKTPEKKLQQRNIEQRVPSSDYTATPDVTATEELAMGQSPKLTEKQRSYKTVLPDVIDPIVPSKDVKASKRIQNTKSKIESKASETLSYSLSSGNSQSSNQTSLFSKLNSGTGISSSQTESQSQSLEQSPQITSTTSYKNFGKATLKARKACEEPGDDPSLSLSRAFNKLSLERQAPSKYSQHGQPSAQSLSVQRSLKGFSLKLENSPSIASSKPPSIHETPEASFDQIDILDQKPPELPDMTNNIFSEPPQAYDSTLPLFDSFVQTGTSHENFEIQQLKAENRRLQEDVQGVLRNVLLNLSESNENRLLSNPQTVKLLDFSELLSHIEESAQETCRKIENVKIQQIKIKKQLTDQEGVAQDRETENNALKREIKDLLNEIETKKADNSLLETRLKSQNETMKYEHDLRASLEKSNNMLRSKLDRTNASVEDKDAVLTECTRAVRRFLKLFGDRLSLDDSVLNGFTAVTANKLSTDSSDQVPWEESSLSSQLKTLLDTFEVELDKVVCLEELTHTLESKVSKLESGIGSQEYNNNRLQSLLNTKESELVESEGRNGNLKQELMRAELDLERIKEQVRSFEHTDSEIKSAMKQGALKLQEAEARSKELMEEKKNQDTRISEMQILLKDQMKLVEEANLQIEVQSEDVSSLQESLESLKKKHGEMTKMKDRLQTNVDYLSQKVEEKDEKIQELTSLGEKNANYTKLTLKSKEEELKVLKQKVKDLEEAKEALGLEIRDTRNSLSDRITRLSDAEKKLSLLNKNLLESQEANRSLRSDILRNGILKQDLKRTLIDVCVSLVKEFEGIIDETSLSTVKEGLQSDVIAFENDEEKQIMKLKDVSVFIEEAISLVIREYWSLNKKVSDTHKLSLSNSSLGALQRINGVQANKIKKMEGKVQYYETLFKKINNVNERPSTTHIQASNSRSIHNNISSQATVQFASESQPNSSSEMHSDNESIKSTTTVLREKQQEITRLLSRVGRKSERYSLDY